MVKIDQNITDTKKDIKVSELKDLYKTLNDDMKHLEKKYLVEAKESYNIAKLRYERYISTRN